jgi:hypothetical protein
MKKIKYIYKGKEALHAKLVFGEMTLADVLEVVCHPGYMIARNVRIQLDGGEVDEQRFRFEGDELHTFKLIDPHEYDGPTLLWFKLDEKVRVFGDVVEICPLKGTRKKLARIQFMTLKGSVDIFERTRPIPEESSAGR